MIQRTHFSFHAALLKGSDYVYACPDAIQRVGFSSSFKLRGSRSQTVMRDGYYANGFRFDSYLSHFRFVFFSLLFFGLMFCYI